MRKALAPGSLARAPSLLLVLRGVVPSRVLLPNPFGVSFQLSPIVPTAVASSRRWALLALATSFVCLPHWSLVQAFLLQPEPKWLLGLGLQLVLQRVLVMVVWLVLPPLAYFLRYLVLHRQQLVRQRLGSKRQPCSSRRACRRKLPPYIQMYFVLGTMAPACSCCPARASRCRRTR